MSKKGFTLVELVGVVIILALIAIIAFPPILNAIRQTEGKISDASKEILYSATELYVSENTNTFPRINGNTYCITLESLVQGEYLPSKVYDATSGDEIPLTNIVEAKYEQDRFSYNLNNECVEYVYRPPFDIDNSGANKPELLDNMMSIYYDGTNWIVSDGTQQQWYNYDNKEWANAVVLNDGVNKNVGDTISEDDIALWYVWIPRYKYQLFNANNGSVSEQLINITFESGTSTTGTVTCTDAISGSGTSSQTCTNASNGNWYTHPAFTFGDEELTGFWVGKFEISGSTDKITIKPNVSSLRNETNSSFFTAIQNIKTTYNLNGDSHMMKNMEWGAVAYLSHSKYGIGEEVYKNNSSSYYTGRSSGTTESEASTYGSYTYDGKIVGSDGNIGEYAGDRSLGTKASTTGTIYGVYDMNGGAYERVMGNMVNSSGNFNASSSGFSEAPEEKYYDKYTYNSSSTTHSRGKLGDATKETLSTYGNINGGWYSDYANFVRSAGPWFLRGGGYGNVALSGVFYFYGNTGTPTITNGARAVLTP